MKQVYKDIQLSVFTALAKRYGCTNRQVIEQALALLKQERSLADESLEAYRQARNLTDNQLREIVTGIYEMPGGGFR